jgi:hypothetical protein
MLEAGLRTAAVILGAGIVLRTFLAAITTFVLPRSSPDVLTRAVFQVVVRLFRLRARTLRSAAAREQLMAYYAPIGLLTLPFAWLTLVAIGYLLIYWGLGFGSLGQSFVLSGSSLLTLGIEQPAGILGAALVFSEAALGLVLVALLIGYLPTIYAAFSRREAAVTLLEVRAGSPPEAVEILARYHRLGRLDRLGDQWAVWETWFADVEESHTSLAALVFFRSPVPERSWVTAAGAVLDSAALSLAALDIPYEAQAALTIRSGYVALRRIAQVFRIPFDPHPKPDAAISMTRLQFDEALDRLHSQGVPLKPDRDQAWRDFAGWRVNYDAALLGLARLTRAPEAPWLVIERRI